MSNVIISEINSLKETIIKMVFSNPTPLSDYHRIIIRKSQISGQLLWHAERFKGKQVFHINMNNDELAAWIEQQLVSFKQFAIFAVGRTITFLTKNGKDFKRLSSHNQIQMPQDIEHNKSKNYILGEGEDIPALRDLGVFSAENKVIKPMYDKFRQINRFVEIIDDYMSKEQKQQLTIVDFGCGKSYLTFILYYYFRVKKNLEVKIFGFDLKADVVKNCNDIAQKYGYDNLKFEAKDVSKGNVLDDINVDIMVSLHACDIATDYALEFAISHNVKYVFSVPCCQHEINAQIQPINDMEILLKYGLIKERVSALLTDAIRAELLEAVGYKVDVIEFVDLAHSPKNIMLRAKKVANIDNGKLQYVKQFLDKYNIRQKLYQLITKQ